MSVPAVLLPVKAFDAAKARLAPALDEAQRSELAAALATAVVQACQGAHVAVVCEHRSVAAWARELGAHPIHHSAAGLNAAVRHGVRVLADEGFDRVLIAHADIAEPSGLVGLLDLDGIVLVPDLDLDGTNAMVIPTRSGFSFSYGPGSFARHLSEAERLGPAITVVRDHDLGLDLDSPADLDLLAQRKIAAEASPSPNPGPSPAADNAANPEV